MECSLEQEFYLFIYYTRARVLLTSGVRTVLIIIVVRLYLAS